MTQAERDYVVADLFVVPDNARADLWRFFVLLLSTPIATLGLVADSVASALAAGSRRGRRSRPRGVGTW